MTLVPRMRRLLLPAAACLVLAAAWPGTAAREKDQGKDPEPPDGPAVSLKVSPRHGFRPLTLTLTGTLTGVDAQDPGYCHAGIEWEATTPSGRVTVSREDPRCLHPPEQVEVQFSFTKTLTIYEAGLYHYRFYLYRRDGSRLGSITQEVRVIDLP